MKIRCISPHGGCRDGMLHNGDPVTRLPDGSLPDIPDEKLRLPANPGGYVYVPNLGRHVAAGEVVDVPDGYEPNLFHFEIVQEAPPQPDNGKAEAKGE
jgi:hypothetical protein